MSLEDKVISPAAPVEPSPHKSELPAKISRKRRKNEGASLRRSRRLDDDDSAEVSAVLTLGADDGPRRPPKRMLFETDDGVAAALPATANEQNHSVRAVLSMTAAPVETVPPPQVAAPLAPPKAAATLPPQPSTPASIDGLHSEAPRTVAAAGPPLEPKEHSIGNGDAASRMATQTMSEPDPASALPRHAGQPECDVTALANPIDSEPTPSATADAYDSVTPAVSDAADDRSAASAPDVADGAGKTDMAVAAPPTGLPDSAALATSWPEPTPAVDPEPPSATIDAAAKSEIPAATAAVQALPAAVQPRPAESTMPTEPPPREPAPSGLSRSEAIARAARMSALSGSRTNGATASPSTMRSPPPLRAEIPKHPADLFGYWARVKNGRRFPSRADFDVDLVAENLPNSMLLTCGGIGGGHVNFSSILRLGGNRRSRPGEELTFTSMITEWILAIGGEAVRAGRPVQDTEVFPSSEGSFAYKIVALPLSDQQSRVDHVLCHLSRS